MVLLGVTLDSNLSWTLHVDNVVSHISQRFYLMNQLKKMGLDLAGLNSNFSALVVGRVRYALPVFSGSLLQGDIDRINAAFRKGKRWGLTNVEYDFDLISTLADTDLARKVDRAGHCLHPLIPPARTCTKYNLRPIACKYDLPKFKFDKLKTSFIYRSFS